VRACIHIFTVNVIFLSGRLILSVCFLRVSLDKSSCWMRHIYLYIYMYVNILHVCIYVFDRYIDT